MHTRATTERLDARELVLDELRAIGLAVELQPDGRAHARNPAPGGCPFVFVIEFAGDRVTCRSTTGHRIEGPRQMRSQDHARRFARSVARWADLRVPRRPVA